MRAYVAVCALIGLVLAVGCANLPKTPPVAVSHCLPMISYTPAQQRQAADELAKLPADSTLVRLMVDYGALRAANRACAGN